MHVSVILPLFYFKAKGWFAAPWWTPYLDEEFQRLIERERLVDWSPNE